MTFTSIDTALEWMNSQSNDQQRQSLDKIRLAFEFLGNPHHGLPVIHITGTNGKGSTTAYLKDMLLSQGLKVATFTSPHIMTFNERLTFDGELISDEDLLALLNKMYEVNEYMETTDYGRLVFFELYTIMMGLYFSWKQPDVCLIEVGIGGYHDATNVIDGQIAVVTTIGLDHADKLGDTIEAVSKEKSGIIKAGSDVVTGDIPESSFEVFHEKALEENAEEYRYGKNFHSKDIQNLKHLGSEFVWDNDDVLLPIRISMVGEHQIHNASVALQVFYLWMSKHAQRTIDWNKAQAAIRGTKWLARMEKIHDQPLVYIDGAHNVAGLQAVHDMMRDYFNEFRFTILYAGLSTKNQEEQLPMILQLGADQVYLTEFAHNNAMTAFDFEHLDLDDERLPEMVSWQDYIQNYLTTSQDDQHLLLVTGSLYFVSDVRDFVLRHSPHTHFEN